MNDIPVDVQNRPGTLAAAAAALQQAGLAVTGVCGFAIGNADCVTLWKTESTERSPNRREPNSWRSATSLSYESIQVKAGWRT